MEPKRSTMKRVLLAVVVVALLGGLGWRIWEKVGERNEAAAKEGSGRKGGVVPVTVEPVRSETIRDIRTFTGTLRPDSEYKVAPKIVATIPERTSQGNQV